VISMMENDFIRKKLVRRKDGFSPKVIGKNICQNKAVELLHRFRAIEVGSFQVHLSKIPPSERSKINQFILSSTSPFRTCITPIPDPENEYEFNISYLNDRGYLYVEAFGGNHDTLAFRLLSRIIEVACDVSVEKVGREDEFCYNKRRYSNLAKILRKGVVVGLIHWVKTDKCGREQIIAKVESKKILVKYDTADFLVRVSIFCCPQIKKKAWNFLKPFYTKFLEISELTPKRFLKYSSRHL